MPRPDAFAPVTPTPEQFEQMVALRSACRQVADQLTLTPPGWYRNTAQLSLEAVALWANKAITHGGGPDV